MPYILPERRPPVREGDATTAGELNYLLTCITNDYLSKRGLSYQSINDVLGAMEGFKLEFYRRVVGPYEDQAKDRNGDVYF